MSKSKLTKGSKPQTSYYGFSIANNSEEPAWFCTRAAAKRFAKACWPNEQVEIETCDTPEPCSIMDTPEKPWTGDSKPQNPSVIPGLEIVIQFHGQSWRDDIQDTILRDSDGNWYLGRGSDDCVGVDGVMKPLDEVLQGEIQQVTLAAAVEHYFLCSKFTDSWTGSQDDLLAAAIEQLKAS